MLLAFDISSFLDGNFELFRVPLSTVLFSPHKCICMCLYMWLRTLRWAYFRGSSGWAQSKEMSEDCDVACFEDWGRRPQAKEYECLLEAGKGK